MVLSVIIFVVVYVLIATERMDKTVAVLLGASAMLAMHLLSFEEAVAAVDLNVLFLLVGMMIGVFVLSKTGFFEWVAVSVAKRARGNPMAIMLLFILVTAVLSAFLDNVTTIILLSPVTILIAEILDISPVPFLVCEVLASNIGGTATLVGDPPNIIIGSQADLSFNAFLVHVAPAILIVMAFFLGSVYFLFRKHWRVPDNVKARVTEALPHRAILDAVSMRRALWIFAFIFAGFFTHDITGIKPGIIALCGSMVMILVCRAEVDKTFMKVEWGAIFFFIGLFMLVAGLEVNGAIQKLAEFMIHCAGNNLFLLCMTILVGSALVSSLLDNIPFVMAMIPMIKKLIVHVAGQTGATDPVFVHFHIAQPLWWSLVLGACLGGNGTLIGASANVVMSKISERSRHPVTFRTFFCYGFPFMIQSIVISGIYIWLCYFLH